MGRLLLALAWLAALVLLAQAFRCVGERWPATAVMQYWPPAVWLLPGPPLLVIALLRFDFKMLLTLATAAVVWLHCLGGYRPPLSPNAKFGGSELVVTLLTNNTGERGKVSLRPFKDRIQPDLLLLQDAPSRARRYKKAPGYEEFPHAEDAGEFTLVSKHPILCKELITRPPTELQRMMRYPIAARFEVEVQGQRIAIYNVHAFSPRDHLQTKAIASTVLSGALGWLPGTRWQENQERYAAFWNTQLTGMEHLVARIQSEMIPCLVGGDFNAPPLGAIHHHLTQHLQDAHADAGRGFGYTFPGQTRNPLALFRPWLRLDYIFASPHWQCHTCEVEPDSPAQHLAVAATFTLQPGQ
jgi:endonuclease/exonuclease/phosphatase (EEP) superfamily protein YafD